jgi:gliding motility-associated-like protein
MTILGRRLNFNVYNHLYCFLLACFALICCDRALAQAPPTAGDCLGGFRVCEQSYTQATSFIGEGNVSNEFPPGTCLEPSGEKNNAWYIVRVETPGLFGFNVIPNISNADYDWVVFDITDATCDDIPLDFDLELLLACDFASNVTPTPVTGMNNGSNPQDEPMELVQAGTILAICINNFSGLNNAGYTLQFNIPGATAGIIDNEAPKLFPIANASCGADRINFKFDEFVLCESVDVSDFTLVNPIGDTVQINNTFGNACENGGEYEKDFILLLDDQLLLAGDYILHRSGQVVDLCGNVAGNPDFVSINISAFEIATLDTVHARCPSSNGGATITITSNNALDNYTYRWFPSNFIDGPSPNLSSNATALPYGTNWVIIENQNGCLRADTFLIEDKGGFDVDSIIIDDTCSSGIGKIYLNVDQTTPPVPPADYQYFWDVPGQVVNNDTIVGLFPGTYSYTVTNPAGCVYRDSVVVPDFRYNLSADFLFSPDENPITGMFPTVTFINLSQFATEFIWDFDSGDTSDVFEPQYIFPGSGTYNVQLMAINQFGCKDSVSKEVTIDFLLNLYFPSAFTPDGDNINDTFNFVTTGIIDSTFEMQIFDKWGGLIFQTNNLREGWDGKSPTGDILPSGVYAYKIFFYDQSGKKRQVRGRFIIFT